MQLTLSLFLGCLSAASAGDADSGPIMEIDFEPLDGPGGGDQDAMLGAVMQAMGGGRPPPQGALRLPFGSTTGKTKKADREDELDRAMQGMFGKQLSKQGPMGAQGQSHHAKRENDMDRAIQSMLGDMMNGPDSFGGPIRSSVGFGGLGPPIQMLRGPMGQSHKSWGSPDGTQIIEIDGFPGGTMGSEDGPPLDMLRGLFPGPLMIEDSGGGRPMSMEPGPAIFSGGPDPLVMGMLQDMGAAFQDDMMPTLHSAPGASRAPNSCHGDIKAHCSTARSQVHCLGQHQADISANCRKDVGKSVPFLCHKAIDQYCDVLQTGLLSCLGTHLQDVTSDCKDAILTTQQVIAKVAAVATTAEPKPVVVVAAPMPLLDSAATTIAKTADAKLAASLTDADLRHRYFDGTSAVSSTSAEAASNRFWMVLLIGVVVTGIYAFMFSDGRRRAYTALKPFIYLEGAQPLRGGVELPKPVDI